MSFDSQASSRYGAVPFELFWFTMVPPSGTGEKNWRMTSGDIERTYLTQVYVPDQIKSTEKTMNQELSEGSIDITIPSDHELALMFLRGMPIAPIALTKYEGHDGDAEVIVSFTGRVQTASLKGQECTLHCAPDHQAVKKSIPSVCYQNPCNHVVYSPSCGLPEAGWGSGRGHAENELRFAATIATVTGRTITVTGDSNWTSAFTPFPSDDTNVPTCAWGYITLPSGRAIMIESHTATNTLVLNEYDEELAVGLDITANRGCRRTLTHCKYLFKNSGQQPRWMGFDMIPNSNPFRGLY